VKIAIATVQVPFITGGAEVLVKGLQNELKKRHHLTEIVSIPFKWYPSESLINSMIMGRMIDLTEVNGEKIDLIIAMKFPAYYCYHPNKVIWLMHQHRQAYDFWDTDFSDICKWDDGNFIRNSIFKNDKQFLLESQKIFTIAGNVSKRLDKFNNIKSTVLYPPPLNYRTLHCNGYENFIFYPSRIDKMKRQRVLVEAAEYIKSDVKIYIAGGCGNAETAYLEKMITAKKLETKVKLLGYISEDKKIDLYSRCLAVYFGAYDEDYGYITLESFFSKKPVIVHKDAGGPLEFVEHGKNGFVLDEDPKLVADKIDIFAQNKYFAKALGINGYNSLAAKNINWDYVINRLLNYE